MESKGHFSRKHSSHIGALAVVVAFLSCGMKAAEAQKTALAPNDISILFPAPTRAADLTKLIRVNDLVSELQRSKLWPAGDFTQFVSIAETSGQMTGSSLRLRLPNEVKSIDTWFVAGIRLDAGAPGLSKAVIDQFGQQPQIRLVIQPITQGRDGSLTVHDIAGHLIYSFATPAPDAPAEPGCFPRPRPDAAAFTAVVRDFTALRDKLAGGQFGGKKVSTAGRPLDVHPGFAGNSGKPFRDAIKGTLEKHLVPQRLTAMAIMGLDFPEPWIFVAMQKNFRVTPPPFGAVPSPTLDGRQFAQALNFRGGDLVVPEPQTNNLNPITCKHAALAPSAHPTGTKGVATAELFREGTSDARLREIADIVSDPVKSHFFNTDCVSCHTETRRLLNGDPNRNVEGIAKAVLPKEDWNVRNFGWFTSFLKGGPAQATVTRRTATETAEVLHFINSQFLTQ